MFPRNSAKGCWNHISGKTPSKPNQDVSHLKRSAFFFLGRTERKDGNTCSVVGGVVEALALERSTAG